jgi:UDP-N-acetylmuramate--alanine ligase
VPQLDQKNYRANSRLLPDLKKIFAYILTGSQTGRDESLRKKYRFAIEADEFNKHFLYLDTDYAIILNAELDHSDIYENEKIYLEAFTQFINKVKKTTYALS